MTTTTEPAVRDADDADDADARSVTDIDPAGGRAVRQPADRRPGRGDVCRARAHRRPARALSRAGRCRRRDRRRAGRENRPQRPVRERMAAQPGRRGMDPVPTGARLVPAAARTCPAALRRKRADVHGRWIRLRRSRVGRRERARRIVPDRRRYLLAPTRPATVQRSRALLPTGLPGQPDDQLATRARRRRRTTRPWNLGRRRGLWPRRGDHSNGPRLPQQHLHRVRLPRRINRRRPTPRRRRRGRRQRHLRGG